MKVKKVSLENFLKNNTNNYEKMTSLCWLYWHKLAVRKGNKNVKWKGMVLKND